MSTTANVPVTPGSGLAVATYAITEDAITKEIQRVVPSDSSGAEIVPPTSLQVGSVTETAPATDTASSGLNGRLQRIAQRISSLIALLPGALGAGGGLKVDGSGTALPVSGTVTAAQATAASLNATVVGTGTFAVQAASTLAAETTKVIGTVRNVGNAGGVMDFAGQNAAAPANSLLVGAEFNTSPTTVTSGNASPLQMDAAGNLLVNIKAGSSSGAVAQGSTTSGQTGSLIQGAVTTAAPTYTTAQTSPLSLDTTGALRVNVTAGGAGGGIVTQATAANLNATVQLSDGTHAGTIKAASTAVVAGDTALAVGLHPTSPLPAGTNVIGHVIVDTLPSGAVTNAGTFAVQVSNANANGSAVSASSAPVVIASDQAAVKVLPGVTATASGATASRINAAASTNATSLKASAGQLYTLDFFNVAAYNVFFKLYNKASAPTVGTDTPIMTIPVQAGGGYSKTWPMGLSFATGIAYAITKLQADSDTTVLVAGDLTGNTTWI